MAEKPKPWVEHISTNVEYPGYGGQAVLTVRAAINLSRNGEEVRAWLNDRKNHRALERAVLELMGVKPK